MAQDPDRPLDDGKVGLPRIDGGMNRLGPKGDRRPEDGKGAKPLRTKEQEKKFDEQEVIRRAIKRFERAVKFEDEIRKAGLDDDKFYSGEQWPSDIVAARNFDRRPILTINKLPTFIHQITNDQRMNRPSINISPIGDKSDVDSAKIYRGLIKSIERNSFAEIAYDTGFESAARKGWGYWRIITEWERGKSFNQVIRVKRVRNAYSVYLDPDRQEPDGSDAKWGFVTEMVTREDYREKWPGADPMMWSQTGIGDQHKLWIEQSNIRIAEYYEIEHETKTLIMLSNGHVGYEDELADEAKELLESGHLEIVAEREADVPSTHWYFLTARQILEEKPWPGCYIPIVECQGEEIDIEGKIRKWGIVRHAKDAQKMYNYWSSAETEHVALAPKAKFMMAEGQDEGYENEYKTANTSSHVVLHYRQKDLTNQPAPPPIPVAPPALPAAIVTAKQGSAQDMMAVTGIRFDATLQERVYDESGRALRELEKKGDLGQFHLIDNFARALKHTGEIMIDLIPKVYETKQVVTILREDDTEELVMLDPHAPPKAPDQRSQSTGRMMKIFNPNIGEYGVTATIGPSYATQEVEAGESMMDFVRAVPEARTLIMDLVAKTQKWPRSEEIAARLARAQPPGLLQPEMKDVPPQVQALLGSMQQQLAQAQQEKAALMAQVMDKNADRAVKMEQIDHDFEAKLLNIVAQVETKMAAIQQKAEQAVMTQIGTHLQNLAEGVNLLRDELAKPAQANGKAS